MKDKNTVKDLIINDKVLEAINLLYEWEEKTELVNEIIILKSNLITLQKKIRAGILSHEEENRSLNRIKYDLLNLIPKIGKNNLPQDEESAYFSFDQPLFESKISQLTQDQFKVLNFIKKMSKVRISGCAGSGKTLVASEKAIRLSKQGIQVLMLCHNPNLALKIKKLVSGTDVFVSAFGQFIHNLIKFNNLSLVGWNKYYEPLTGELEQALKVIENRNISFDAVIVDEAQDFREEWWILVEAILEQSRHQIFYIFHDDNQALLPFRSYYPIEEPIVDLSKNCRNGGKIFDFIKSNFHHQAPETSIEIKDIGSVKLFVYKQREHIKTKVFSAIEWMKNQRGIDSPVVLLAGDINYSNWEMGAVRHSIPKGAGWRSEIIGNFERLTPKDASDALEELSNNILPTPEDIALVCKIADQEFQSIDRNHIHARLGPQIAKSNRVAWKEEAGKSVLSFEHADPFTQKFFLFKLLSSPDWAKSLEKELTYEFTDQMPVDDGSIPVFETASFKGLESDGVILVTKGQSHAYLNELYVASSRARKVLAIVIDKKNENFYIP